MAYIGNQPGTGVRSRFIYTATASQTTFSGADNNSKTLKYSDADYIDVYLNGVCLVPVTDYAASTKTSVVLTQAASLSDTLEVVAYDIATISDTVSKANGGTFDGNITITTNDNSNPLTLKSTDDDASIGPVLEFNRSSSSPADNDQIGRIDMVGKNDADQDVDYVVYVNQIRDTTDGTEDGRMAINTAVNGIMSSRMNVEPTETVFNDESNDIDFRVESDGNANMLFVAAGTNRVGIGVGEPTINHPFMVQAAANADFVASIDNTGTNPYILHLKTGSAADDDGNRMFIFASDTAATRFQVLNDGDVQNHDNSYGAISDERVKQDISDATSQWDDIKSLKVRKFKLKDDVRQHGDDAKFKLGLISQEAEAVSPNLITENPAQFNNILSSSEFGSLYEDGDDLPPDYEVGDVKERKDTVKGIKYSILYMKAIKALQEAMTRIETLETKVAALEAG
jgi:hypothetical protein